MELVPTAQHRMSGSLMVRSMVGNLSELENALRALTLEDIQSAFQRHVNLDRMSFMKGGDFANAPDAAQ